MTTTHELRAALERAQAVFRRRPEMGMHDDSEATASWQGGTRVVTRHPGGTEVASDLPAELGGTGDRITPGWLFRAGLAACASTSIVMAAAARGIELTRLEVSATSRSDTRALLGLSEADGSPVSAAPQDVRLLVRVAANGVSAQALRDLVEAGCACSPVPNALQSALPLELRIETTVD